jgi:autotransporter-associated beta strand protein
LTISSGAATPTFGNNTDNNATFSGNITLGHATDIYSAAVSSGNALTVSGVLSGSNGITLTGPGTTVLSATNTFTGKVNINSGVLSVATINNVSASSGSNLGKQTTVANATIGIGAGTLKYTGATVTTNRPISLSTTGGTLDGSGTGLLTVDVASGNAIAGTNTSFTLAGSTGGKINDPISLGTGSLSKSGTGTWTLAAANSYTGATNVSGGTLALASTSSITSSSSINISSGATFDASAFSTFNIGSSQMLTGTGGTAKGTYSIAGTLDGSVMFDHNVTMGSNSTLQGTGTITGNINTGGTIKGAGSIVGNISSTGSITDRYITGNVTLSGNGSLGGNAVVNGNVQLSTPGSQLSGDVKITGTLSGSGIVGPGNSPGLLTATHLDPSAGMSFNFEMTKDGAPDYANIADIGNDVLRLTDSSTPLSTPFTSANVVNFYIENTAFNGSSSETMLGGLFTDSTTPNVLSSLSSATINYYVETPGGSISYNGNTYSPLNTSSFSTHLSVIADSADFASGMVNGQVTELSITTAVPLPGSAVAGTVLLAGLYIRRTRSRRRAIKGNRI